MRRLTLLQIEPIRHTKGRTLQLFLTERHVALRARGSGAGRSGSSALSDWRLFESVLGAICDQPQLSLIGVSGGEPFSERRGLQLAADRLTAAGKDLMFFTSGVWANARVPAWILGTIRQAACVFLDSNVLDGRVIEDTRFVRAARTIADEGVWLVVQVPNQPERILKAEELLEQAFGTGYADHGELSLAPQMPHGGDALPSRPEARRPGASFGSCGNLAMPVVRYDGVVCGCHNERVAMGFGPARLRQGCADAAEVAAALGTFGSDPLLEVLGELGGGALTSHPRFSDLADQQFSCLCDLCWAMQERALPLGDHSDRLLAAMALLGSETKKE